MPTSLHDPQAEFEAKGSSQVIDNHRYCSEMTEQQLHYQHRESIKRQELWDPCRAFQARK